MRFATAFNTDAITSKALGALAPRRQPLRQTECNSTVLPITLKRVTTLLQAAAFATAALTTVAADAKPGELDTSFGDAGFVRRYEPAKLYSIGVLPQADGRIVQFGGVHEMIGFAASICKTGILTRFNADGSLDTTFGDKGTVAGSDVVARPTTLLDRRCLSSGHVQPDGKIAVFAWEGVGAAYRTIALRFSADGRVDETFGEHGYAIIHEGAPSSPISVALQSDGSYIALVASTPAGFVLAKMTSSGVSDSTFGVNGGVVVPISIMPLAVAVQTNGRIVVSGSREVSEGPTRQAFLVGVRSDGEVDTTFGTNGVAVSNAPNQFLPSRALAIQADQKVVVGGGVSPDFEHSDFGLIRFSANGMQDVNFGEGGVARTPINGAPTARVRGLTLMPNGKIVAVGYGVEVSFAGLAARYDQNGVLDPQFGTGGISLVPAPRGAQLFDGVAVLSDASLAVNGAGSGATLAKLLPDPTLDAIEFYNAALDHFFLSAAPQEVHDLDFGVHRGWARTGLGFKVFTAGHSVADVARIYIPPGHGDSHFFTADPVELSQIKAKIASDPNYSGYIIESQHVFAVTPPDAIGACPPEFVPVYRLWNQRADSNHRYTTSIVQRTLMIGRGYLSEGSGPLGVVMCAAS
jgi:uncharacterized delta-60 repeat protein